MPQTITPANLTPMANGITNSNYLITVATKNYVLRVNSKFSNKYAIDRFAENLALTALASKDYTPNIIYNDLDNGYLISEYIAGKHLEIEQLTRRQLQYLHYCIKDYQSLTIAKTIDYAELLENYQQQLNINTVPKQLLADIRTMQQNTKMQLCHHDLSVSNIIWQQDKCILIDWESAQNGFAMWDYYYLGLTTTVENAIIADCINYINSFWYKLHKQLENENHIT